ncbi:unnamed protein product [Caenorhabditis bovis]|uniref:C2 domain-containing protein n=1 Tax=Caenorhabditis bovis TaxID=2654633 RepID=A0A8S1F419_9PELO|nr:unnamed protein product [Caenorhabditis bovis]
MYEMCRSEQSVAGCKEAVLYLENACNDFKSLIETINVEKEWANKEPEKRLSVAWEIRKSMSSPIPVPINEKPLLPISSMIAEVVRNANHDCQNSEESPNRNLSYARITAAAAAVAVAAVAAEQNMSSLAEDGWQVVGGRRRKSTSSTTVSEFDREVSVEKEQAPSAPLNVYERLSSSSYRRNTTNSTTNRSLTLDSSGISRLTCPRSAMDLPQTKASMAKMAYSRQLLWEKNQQSLVEKLRARQKREKMSNSHVQSTSSPGSSRSPTCGFTFADPQAVRKSVEAFNQKRKAAPSNRDNNAGPSNADPNRSLQSISEHEPGMEASINSDDVPADPTPPDPHGCTNTSKNLETRSEPGGRVQNERTESSPHNSLFGYIGLENDAEWREMTEEEESLAMEENSLKQEIKQAEAISIDAELERQVAVEADGLERAHRKEKKKTNKKQTKTDLESFCKVLEDEIKSLANVAWSELMNNTPPIRSTNVHEPGSFAEKHEKMSSPSRRRSQKDDDDLGRRHELKLKRAEELRQQLQEAKTAKLKELTRRVEEVLAKQEALKERKRRMMEERMQRATENRDKNISEVIRKAKDDDQRVMEVKFIATLQEENKRQDLIMKDASNEEKQKQLADERARKNEEKAAKKREQEAAAVTRRKQAAEARQNKIRQLNEQKEAKMAAKDVENKTLDEPEVDFLTRVVKLLEEDTKTSVMIGDLLSTEKHRRNCHLCSFVVDSDFEAISHIFAPTHQLKTTVLRNGATPDEIKNHLNYAFKPTSLELSSALSKDDREEQMMRSREILEKIQIKESVPIPLSSPRNRTKFIRELLDLLEKFSSSKLPIDEQLQSDVEKSLTEILSAIEADEKNDCFVNLEQLCATGIVPKLVDFLLEWTSKGASLRLCIRFSHVLSRVVQDARVSYSIIFKPELLKILERIVFLSDPTNLQLSSLLDCLCALLKCSANRINEKQRRWRELYSLDEKISTIIRAIAGFLTFSLEPADMENALEKCRGSVLIGRILTLSEFLARNDNEIGFKFLSSNVKIASAHAYRQRKSENMKVYLDLIQCFVNVWHGFECRNVTKMNDDELKLCQQLTEFVKHSEIQLEPSNMENYGEQIETSNLIACMKIVGFDERIEAIIEKFEDSFSKIYSSILSFSLACWKRSEKSKNDEIKRGRMALRLLVNLVGRSSKFAENISSCHVDLIESLLAIEIYNVEIFHLLLKTANISFMEFQKNKRYSKLHVLLIDAFYRANQKIVEKDDVKDNEASTILAYFSILLEKDYAFLANSYAEIEFNSFSKLLEMTELIIESTETRVHSNNMLFVLNLLELICYDFATFLTVKNTEQRKSHTIFVLKILVEIVGLLCTKTEMTSHMMEQTTAIDCVVDVLDTILHGEALFGEYRNSHPEFPEMPPDEPKFAELRKAIREEKRIQDARNKQPDKPILPTPSRIERIQENSSLTELAQVFLNSYKNIGEHYGEIGELKLNCLQTISHLCDNSQFNKRACSQNRRCAILSVLQCTLRRPMYFMESYAIQKWAIFCVRQLTDDSVENKEIILNLEDPKTPIIDKDKLLKEFGLKTVYDKNNIRRIMDFNFADMEKSVYGGNIEEDEELLAELAAIQAEEMGETRRRAAPSAPTRRAAAPPTDVPGVDPRVLAAALADAPGDVDDASLEEDPELLGELAGLVGGESPAPPPPPPTRAAPPPTQAAPPVPARSAPPAGPAPSVGIDHAQLSHLRQLHDVYHKMLKSAEQGGEGAKARRYKRAVDKLADLMRAVERGRKIDPAEIPVAPPNFVPTPFTETSIPQSAHHPPAPSIREAASTAPPPVPARNPPPPIPARNPQPPADPKKAEIFKILNHRRDLYVANGKAAIAAHDKEAAKEFVAMAKSFDQAIAALDQVSADEMDLNEVPPSPPPYRKHSAASSSAPSPAPPPASSAEPSTGPRAPAAPAPAPSQKQPSTFMEALEFRRQRYVQMATKAKQDGNERKTRMNQRLAGQYAEAIKEAKAGRPVNIGELPTLPDMPPLPPQNTAPAPKGPPPGLKPPPEVGPLAPSGVAGKSRNSSQLEFLIQRQTEFKQAALNAKNRGDIERAKKYLMEAKGFDKMIQAARAGLPVSIKQTPIPPQSKTTEAALQPRIQPSTSSSTGLENRGERLALLEKTLIEQVRLAETNQMRFTRLGDVGKVRLFESWAKASIQDLLLIRAVAQQGLNLPKFHYEKRHIPSADLFPDLAEDALELTITKCRDVPLPSGYEPHHANIYVKYCFPFPTEKPQEGKTKTVSGTCSPEFNEIVMLNIGSGKLRNSKLQRAFKRGGMKFEVYQKGGFMRSDKLLGTCEWKLEQLESSAEVEESLPLKEGRKAIGGLASARIRIREPIGDAKAQTQEHKWLVLDN